MRNQPVSPKTPDSSLVAGDLDGAWSICVVAQKEPQSEQNMTFRTVDMCAVVVGELNVFEGYLR